MLFRSGAWGRMSYRPTIQTFGKAEIRCQRARAMAALTACLLLHACFVPLTDGSVPTASLYSRDLGTHLSPVLDGSSLVVLRSYDSGTSHKPLALAADFLVCAETEDPDPFDEDSGHPQAFAEASLIPLGEFSSHDSARARFLPFLAIHSLMNRRF